MFIYNDYVYLIRILLLNVKALINRKKDGA